MENLVALGLLGMAPGARLHVGSTLKSGVTSLRMLEAACSGF